MLTTKLMSRFALATLGAAAVLVLEQGAFACANQQLACRIASTSAQLVGDASAASHLGLRSAAVNQYQVATAFCNCDYSVYTPGSGVLRQRYDLVKFRFGQIGGAPAASQPERNRMLELRDEFGY